MHTSTDTTRPKKSAPLRWPMNAASGRLISRRSRRSARTGRRTSQRRALSIKRPCAYPRRAWVKSPYRKCAPTYRCCEETYRAPRSRLWGLELGPGGVSVRLECEAVGDPPHGLAHSVHGSWVVQRASPIGEQDEHPGHAGRVEGIGPPEPLGQAEQALAPWQHRAPA